jgi:uncharacterized protein (DUF169 family)
MDLQQIALAFSCILDLKREIVAVDLVHSEEDFARVPVAMLKGCLSFCAMARLASLGHGRKAKGENISCPGALEVFKFTEPGKEALSGKRLYGFGLYANQEIAADVQTSMARIKNPCLGIATQPLAACIRPPASILFFVNAYQAMRLGQGWAYHHGQLEHMAIVGNRGVCSEGVARPLVTGEPNLSPLCANTRYISKWSDTEMGFGLPYDGLTSILDGLIQTIPAVESPKRKMTIFKRCEAAGMTLTIPKGTCYFLPS